MTSAPLENLFGQLMYQQCQLVSRSKTSACIELSNVFAVHFRSKDRFRIRVSISVVTETHPLATLSHSGMQNRLPHPIYRPPPQPTRITCLKLMELFTSLSLSKSLMLFENLLLLLLLLLFVHFCFSSYLHSLVFFLP